MYHLLLAEFLLLDFFMVVMGLNSDLINAGEVLPKPVF